MFKKCFSIALLLYFFLGEINAQVALPKDKRMHWWRDARFGMFIHWGLYSIPAGEWNGQTNHAEWIRTTAKIPIEIYDGFVKKFNPVKFDAHAWVKTAKEAGMKYIVITTKHHDGFCMFDSKLTDFDIMSTPFHRDVMKELADACDKEGIKLCFYHSIMDCHHRDYLPRRDWENDPSAKDANYDRYVTYLKGQLKELLSNYGKIGVLWFDGEWEGTWGHDRGQDLYKFVKSQQPDIIVNNRVDKGRSGMDGKTQSGFTGDFGTPEQEIPATGIAGQDWESCMTLNDNWGYNSHDNHWKSPEDIIKKLSDIASKGGNFLLNVGPTSEGVFPSKSIEILKEVGDWMKINGEAIYGTQASPFKKLSWGRCTQKKIEGGTRLFLHIFDWPKDNKLTLEGLGNKITRCFVLQDLTLMKGESSKSACYIDVSRAKPGKYVTVLALDIIGDPIVYDSPEFTNESVVFTDKLHVTFGPVPKNATIRYTTDGTEPDLKSPIYKKHISLSQSSTVKAKCFLNNTPVSGTSSQRFDKVTAKPSISVTNPTPGLNYQYYEGKWTVLPDFNTLKAIKSGDVKTFSLKPMVNPDEFGMVYTGYIKIPDDGVYSFFLTSDDGSKLYIDDQLLDNDGLHGPEERRLDFALAKGFHKIRVEFFEAGGGEELSVKWRHHKEDKKAIPGSMLFH